MNHHSGRAKDIWQDVFGIALSLVLLVSLFQLVGSWKGGQSSAAEDQAGRAPEKVYRNEQYGYRVRYPTSWFPSGITYGNALELRNYEPGKAQARPERDRANLLILDMTMESPDAVARFLDGLLAGGSNAEREVTPLTVGGHRAVRVKQLVRSLPGSRGVARPPGAPPLAPGLNFVDLSTYIANGSYVLRLWATVSEGGDPAITTEVLRIEGSVTFQ